MGGWGVEKAGVNWSFCLQVKRSTGEQPYSTAGEYLPSDTQFCGFYLIFRFLQFFSMIHQSSHNLRND